MSLKVEVHHQLSMNHWQARQETEGKINKGGQQDAGSEAFSNVLHVELVFIGSSLFILMLD
eukprot:1038582-Amphidinium_carterae.1